MQFAISQGVIQGATWLMSPNFNQRPNVDNIRLIVIHNISLPPSEFAKTDCHGQHFVKAFFQNQLNPEDHPYFQSIYQLQVSAHVLIERDGMVTQFVNLNDRAWHAGKSCYLGVENCNDFSIGIELEGDDYCEFTDIQYQVLSQLILGIYQSYPKTMGHLAGHSDIARGRKSDPGAFFDWQRLRELIAKGNIKKERL